jgi:hypothetical protein
MERRVTVTCRVGGSVNSDAGRAMSDVWITVVKVALLAYLLIAVVVVIVVRRRRMRASWDEHLHAEPQPSRHHPRPSQPGFEATIRGAGPHTPLPDWMYADEEPEPPTGR